MRLNVKKAVIMFGTVLATMLLLVVGAWFIARPETSGKSAKGGLSVKAVQPVSASGYSGDGTFDHRFTWTYDAEGNVLERLCTYADGSQTKELYTYDNAGNMLTRVYESDGHWNETEYRYDENGNLVYEEYGNSDDSSMNKTITHENMVFDGNGKAVAEDIVVNGSYSGRNEMSYDNRGNCTEKVSYDASGISIRKMQFEYDNRGNVVIQEEYDEQGRLMNSVHSKYDKDGYITEERSDKNFDYSGKTPIHTVGVLGVGAKGRVLSYTDYDYDGSIWWVEIYEYPDDDGSDTYREIFGKEKPLN